MSSDPLKLFGNSDKEQLVMELFPEDIKEQAKVDLFSDTVPLWKKTLKFITGGHIDYGPEPPPEVERTEESLKINVPETAEMGFFEDPLTWGAMGAVAGFKAVGGPLQKAAQGVREAVGWATGGASEVPSVVKGGLKVAAKAASAKNLEKTLEPAMKTAEKGLGVAPTASTGAISGVSRAAQPVGEMYRPIPSVSKTTQAEKPELTRSEMVKTIEDAFDVPIRIGRHRWLSTGKAAGLYKIKPQVIRNKMANDIEVASHEVGHHIQKVLGYPKQMPAEVQAMAYPGAKDVNAEGFAEFVRMYFTDRPAAKKLAPNYFNDFEASLSKNPEIKSVFDKINTSWEQWKKIPSSEKIGSYIVTGKDIETKGGMSFDKFYTAAVDEYNPIKKLTEVAEKLSGKKIPIEQDPFAKAWLTRGWSRRAEQFLKYGQYKITSTGIKFNGPSFKEILKPIEEQSLMKELDAYLVARRGLSDPRIINGFKNQLSRSDFRTTVNEGKEAFEDTARKLYEYQDSLLQTLVRSERISQESADIIRSKNLFYAPLYRAFEAGEKGLGAKGFTKLSEPIKRLKGAANNIISPTENMVYNTFFFMNQAARNEVGNAVAKLSNIEGIGKIIEKVPQKLKPINVSKAEIERMGFVEPDDFVINDVNTIFRPSRALEPNEVVFYVNGKPQHYIIGDKDLYKSLNALDAESVNTLTKVLSYPAKWLRTGATLSPEFILRNPIRDQFSAMVFSKYGYIPGYDLLKGMFHVLKKDELYQTFNASGGAHAALVSLDRNYISKNLDEVIKDSTLLDYFKNPLKSFQKASEFMEEATRVGEFAKGLKKEGATAQGIMRAGIATRDVALDFSRIGTQTKAYNAITAFWNANVQGIDKMAREFTGQNAAKVTAKAIGGLTIPTVLLWNLNKDDQYYQELLEWRKTLFWNIIFHNEDGTLKGIASIPKPFDLGIIFSSVPEAALNWAYTKDPKGMKKAAGALWNSMALARWPSGALTVVEDIANKNLFFDRKIVPRGKEDLPPEMQYTDRTTETMKLIGKAVKYSPAKLENHLRGWTGNLGYLGLQASDKLLKGLGITRTPPKPTPTLADIPGIRGFVQRFPSANTASIENFYDELTQAKQDWAANRAKKDTVEKLFDKKLVQKGLIKKSDRLEYLEEVEKTLSNMRTVIDIIEESEMTPDKKREYLDKIFYRMINTARKAIGKDSFLNMPKPAEIPEQDPLGLFK